MLLVQPPSGFSGPIARVAAAQCLDQLSIADRKLCNQKFERVFNHIGTTATLQRRYGIQTCLREWREAQRRLDVNHLSKL